jgi:hypothetical protein
MPEWISDSVLPNSVFVGLFDVLGFKSLREIHGTHGLYKLFDRSLLSSIQHAAAGRGRTENRGGDDCWVPDFNASSVQFQIFSDTVIMHTPDDSVSSFFNLVHSTHQLLQSGFATKAPFRGAIGHGDFVHDSRGIMLGEAIEDAYIHEAAQAWAGASLSPKCAKFIVENKYLARIEAFFDEIAQAELSESDKKNVEGNRRRLVPYDVPTQTNPKSGPVVYGTIRTYAIDWTIRMFQGASNKALPESENSHASTMRENTITFENWARMNNIPESG